RHSTLTAAYAGSNPASPVCSLQKTAYGEYQQTGLALICSLQKTAYGEYQQTGLALICNLIFTMEH
ncbi:MAG: hypothetical protein NC249_04575, partial [Lachnoclostridium sp.]|nr:hypothetical protein [Lachnoclostridium sp.]